MKTAPVSLCFLLAAAGTATAYWELPSLPPPELYGNVVMDRGSSRVGAPGVAFSHWSHRIGYTCRVCHTELDFYMELNATPVTEAASREGRYCGACHDGKIAFGHTTENCDKCHSGRHHYGHERLKELSYPKALFGNEIDWDRALAQKLIQPKQHLLESEERLSYGKKVTLEPRWVLGPPAVFPHEPHEQWLDCSSCHPEIFNIKKKTTEDLTMEQILKGESCGVCHGRVAFPINNCQKCHPSVTHIQY